MLGGLSMGGYGAITNGLKYHNIFGHVIGLSSALIMDLAAGKETMKGPNAMGTDETYFKMIFGSDISRIPEHEFNPRHAAETVKDELEPDFDLFFCCGINDMLVAANRAFHFYLKKLGISHTYKEGPGTHNFKFWDEWIRIALERIAPKPQAPVEAFFIPDAPPLKE